MRPEEFSSFDSDFWSTRLTGLALGYEAHHIRRLVKSGELILETREVTMASGGRPWLVCSRQSVLRLVTSQLHNADDATALARSMIDGEDSYLGTRQLCLLFGFAHDAILSMVTNDSMNFTYLHGINTAHRITFSSALRVFSRYVGERYHPPTLAYQLLYGGDRWLTEQQAVREAGSHRLSQLTAFVVPLMRVRPVRHYLKSEVDKLLSM